MINHKRNEIIPFALGESWVGRILVAASSKGVCYVSLGDNVEDLIHAMKEKFPEADPEEHKSGELCVYLSKIVDYLENPFQRLNIPLYERGTEFQLRVWQALRAIPVGMTASYSEIAKIIGSPRSVRAVAAACAANPLAILTPCHRVIRSDGTLSGYRWGVDKKRRLLQRESLIAN